MAKKLAWNEEKNADLKARRKISFEEISQIIRAGLIIETIDHPNQTR